MRFLPPLDTLARVVLLPALIWQGLRIRRSVRELPEATGARSGVKGTGQPLRLLIVGDSSAAGVGVTTQTEGLSGQTVGQLAPHFEVTWRLIAKTGATCKSTLEMLKEDRGQCNDTFDVVAIVLGVNDAVRLRSIAIWRRRHLKLRRYIMAHYGAKLLIIPGVPPIASFPALTPLLRWILGAHAERIDHALAKDLSTEATCEYLRFDLPLSTQNMAEDGYHPNAKGYALCGQMAAKRILERYGRKQGDSI